MRRDALVSLDLASSPKRQGSSFLDAPGAAWKELEGTIKASGPASHARLVLLATALDQHLEDPLGAELVQDVAELAAHLEAGVDPRPRVRRSTSA